MAGAAYCLLILGSSHICRMQQYVDGEPERKNFALSTGTVFMYGISGGSMSARHLAMFERCIRESACTHIVVQLGGNDLDNLDITAEEVAYRLIAWVSTMKARYHLNSATIGQFLFRHRTRNLPVDEYNRLVVEVNKLIRESDSVVYWKHKGLKRSAHQIRLPDGVHMNWSRGSAMFYRSLRGACLNALR